MAGKLYLCATPIGNLDDMTFRVLETLKSVDLIAAEDTRNSIKLLNHFDIHTEMTSYHEYNKYDKAQYLIGKMQEGTNVALITDAGSRILLLKQCGLKLPEHTFYVDNIYVFNPLPFVKTMYYLDVNFYYYYIGREDQSVNQKIMLSRIDQQIRVNKLMVDYYVENYGMIRSQRERHKYMFNYLEIITAISSVLLITEDTPENLAKRKELLDYIKEKNYLLYLKIRYSIEGTYIYLPGKGGRKITLAGYKLLQKIFHFN